MNQQYETVSSEPAAADLTGNQWCAVTMNSSGLMAVATAGAMCDGILQNPDAASGKQARYAWVGRLKVKYGGTVAIGADLMVGTGGTLITATTGNVIVGKAQVAGTNGTIGRALWGNRGLKP